MIPVGSKVKDRITGFAGIAIAYTHWLNGCNRVTIQSQDFKDGRPVDPYTCDEQQVIVLARADGSPATPASEEATQETKPTGGPRPEPIRYPIPARE